MRWVYATYVHAQFCPTLCGPIVCSQLDSSVHGIFQAGILEWVAISYSRWYSQLQDRTTDETEALNGLMQCKSYDSYSRSDSSYDY